MKCYSSIYHAVNFHYGNFKNKKEIYIPYTCTLFRTLGTYTPFPKKKYYLQLLFLYCTIQLFFKTIIYDIIFVCFLLVTGYIMLKDNTEVIQATFFKQHQNQLDIVRNNFLVVFDLQTYLLSHIVFEVFFI